MAPPFVAVDVYVHPLGAARQQAPCPPHLRCRRGGRRTSRTPASTFRFVYVSRFVSFFFASASPNHRVHHATWVSSHPCASISSTTSPSSSCLARAHVVSFASSTHPFRAVAAPEAHVRLLASMRLRTAVAAHQRHCRCLPRQPRVRSQARACRRDARCSSAHAARAWSLDAAASSASPIRDVVPCAAATSARVTSSWSARRRKRERRAQRCSCCDGTKRRCRRGSRPAVATCRRAPNTPCRRSPRTAGGAVRS